MDRVRAWSPCASAATQANRATCGLSRSRIFSPPSGHLGIGKSATYEDARCVFCTTVHYRALLIHAKLTQDLRPPPHVLLPAEN